MNAAKETFALAALTTGAEISVADILLMAAYPNAPAAGWVKPFALATILTSSLVTAPVALIENELIVKEARSETPGALVALVITLNV